MLVTKTVIQILDLGLNHIADIKSFVPINKGGTVVQYSRELSDYGKATFRISAYDPILVQYGDITIPHKYHVRILRGGAIVWQGAIISDSPRTKDYIQITAAEYEFYLGRKLVHRTSPDVNGTADIYRTFSSGTMADAVTAIMNETIADYKGSVHILANMTLGTVENPNFPPQMTSDFDNLALTGPWTFGTNVSTARGPQLQYDFHNILYILRSFGVYAYADFKINNSLQFNFKKFYGNNLLSSLVFSYGPQGNITDYNLPRMGERVANSLTAIATDPNGVILHVNPTDQTSIKEYGLMEDVAAYSDVKGQGTLNSRAAAELPLISAPNETNITVYLNEKAYPIGQYDVGDIVTVKVVNKGVNFSKVVRIVGITISLNETGREMIAIQTNIPLPWQYPSS